MVLLLALAGCARAASPEFTLYRNSNIEPSMRVHFASFDAADKGAGPDAGNFNGENCRMAAELLNANVAALNGGGHPVRFWCEKGSFRP